MKLIEEFVGHTDRLIIVSDGVFSMRGDYAPLKDIADLAEEYDAKFEEGIMTIVDDSHGIGAYGKTGRGTPEVTREERIDIISATLGKGLGVDGGFIVSKRNLSYSFNLPCCSQRSRHHKSANISFPYKAGS